MNYENCKLLKPQALGLFLVPFASNIILAARRYGMEADGFKAEHLEQLQEVSPPYIVFWEFNHFLVVEGLSKHWVFLNDPATGPRRVSWEEFDEKFTGVVLVMEPGDDFSAGGRKPSVISGLIDRLRGSVSAIIYCILAGFLLVLPGLAIPVFSQVFVDQVLVENRTEWLRPLILGMFLTTVFQGLLTLLRLRYLRKLRIKLAVGRSNGQDLGESTVKLPMFLPLPSPRKVQLLWWETRK